MRSARLLRWFSELLKGTTRRRLLWGLATALKADVQVKSVASPANMLCYPSRDQDLSCMLFVDRITSCLMFPNRPSRRISSDQERTQTPLHDHRTSITHAPTRSKVRDVGEATCQTLSVALRCLLGILGNASLDSEPFRSGHKRKGAVGVGDENLTREEQDGMSVWRAQKLLEYRTPTNSLCALYKI